MPYVEGQLIFIDYLGYRPVMAMAKKRTFGGLYLTLNDHWAVIASVYEQGAVVGRARRDKLILIGEMMRAN